MRCSQSGNNAAEDVAVALLLLRTLMQEAANATSVCVNGLPPLTRQALSRLESNP